MKHTLHIAYSFNDSYVQHAGISILSLLENNQDIESIIVYIISDSFNKINREKINSIIKKYNREVIYFDLNTLTKDLKINTRFSRSAYGRIFIADKVKADKLIYIDSDTVVKGSLKPLLTVDISHYLVLGVQDTVNPYYLSNIGLNHSHQYINTGFLILNLKLWREKGIVRKCIDFILQYNGNPPHNDQGTINKVCAGFIKILPAKYNVMPPMFSFKVNEIKKLFKIRFYYSQEEIDSAIAHPIIIHYTDEFFNRPWFLNCTHPLKSVYLNNLKNSPWKDAPIMYKKISTNCKIQNWVYCHCSFCIYRSMVRFIEFRHRVKNKLL